MNNHKSEMEKARLDRAIQMSRLQEKALNIFIGLILCMVVLVGAMFIIDKFGKQTQEPKLYCYAGMLHNPAKQQILNEAGRGIPCDRFQVAP